MFQALLIASMWLVAGVVVIAILKMTHGHGSDDLELRERAAAGQVFIAERLPEDGSLRMCGCLQGIPARYLVTCGEAGASGVMCIVCARTEFVIWCLGEGVFDGSPQQPAVVTGEK
jgi:hypothetical protein